MTIELSSRELDAVIDCVEYAARFCAEQPYSAGFLYALYARLTDESVRRDKQ